MLSYNSRFTLNDVVNSVWYNETTANKEEVVYDMEIRKIKVKEARERENIPIEIDSDESDGKKNKRQYRDDGNSDLENLQKSLEDLEVEDDLIPIWNEKLQDSGNYIKCNISHTKLYVDIACSLATMYDGIVLDLDRENLKLQGKYDLYKKIETENTNGDSSIDLKSFKIDDVQAVDIIVKIFKDEDGSVVQFYKNDSMSKFDFRNFYNSLRKCLEVKD
jgi:hypothetical protein